MRMIGRLGVVAAAVAALAGLGTVPAFAAGSEFTCTFDHALDPTVPGLRVDICLERTAAPGLQVRAITWVENGSSQFVKTQIIGGVQGTGSAICWSATQWPGTTRSCTSSWYWDFDGANDRATATITWWPAGQSGKAATVSTPVG